MTQCAVCSFPDSQPYRVIDQVQFHECRSCGSLFADPAFLADVESGKVSNYQHAYWASEMKAARERSYGASLQRIAETFLYCRIPVKRFVDIGSGPGYLLDAISDALPQAADTFYGVEMFPPEQELRSRHPNYKVCSIGDLSEKFDAGVCIEVIEHLTPAMLSGLAAQLAKASTPGALYLINSGQPEYVKTEDPDYLDPHSRGHVVSYSVAGAAAIFKPHGFSVVPLPGRHWAFLIEYSSTAAKYESPIEAIEKRLWAPLAENAETLRNGRLGSLLHDAGRDAARAYLEYATVVQRTAWAQSLQVQVERLEAEVRRLQASAERAGRMDASEHFTGDNLGPSNAHNLFSRARRWLATHTI
ncbi:class I SAM-dependent methyltransferase [Paraburkholderia caribensis]|uniref:class I SAM-dependent methyltransferase n=1 Tax=Paraburkholderia caribensis TaxID=75105 RepID=UPI0031D96EF9